MQKIFAFFMLILVTYHTSAQDFPLFDIGVKAGVNGSYIHNVLGDLENNSMKMGFVGGVWGRVKIPLFGLYVQPELVISQTGGRLKGVITDELGAPIADFTQKITLTNLDGVILLGQRFRLGATALRINLGPVFSHVFSAKSKTDSEVLNVDQDIKDFVNKLQIGLQAGLGLDISRLNIDLRYQHNFSKFFDRDFINDERISAIQLTLGYKIF